MSQRSVQKFIRIALVLILATAPLFSDDLGYGFYQARLTLLYIDGIISFETLRYFWQAKSPSPADLKDLIEYEKFDRVLHGGSNLRSSPAAVTGSYALSSSTPILPFRGNQLVISGAALFANDTNVSAVTLRRQGDCSLVEDIFEPVNNLLTPASFVELPDAQDYLHMLSGLATTPDAFPRGCADPTLGTSAVLDTAPIGVTANNLSLVAGVGFNGGLQVQRIDNTSNTTSTVNLTTGEILAFVVADVNHDGQNDLVASGVTDPATGMPAYATFLNNGDGTFGKPAYVDAPASILFTMDDVNGDGNPDIVFTIPHTMRSAFRLETS